LFKTPKIAKNIEELKQSVEERAAAVKKAEDCAADLRKRTQELSKDLENSEKEYQVEDWLSAIYSDNQVTWAYEYATRFCVLTLNNLSRVCSPEKVVRMKRNALRTS